MSVPVIAPVSVVDQLRGFGVVPVVEVESASYAVPLADALAAGGLATAEITFRTAAGADAIAAIAQARPDFLVGAGSVVEAQQAESAISAGARFTVAPGTSPAVIATTSAAGIPHVPGVVTPSEVTMAIELGCRAVKLFPASVFGGPALMAALTAPFVAYGLQFMPTGGIRPDDLADYLSAPNVFAAGGTWIAPRADIAQGRWDAITERARAATALVAALRRPNSATPVARQER